MILLIDNYDSFSYNLFQLAGMFDSNIKVIRNDEMTVNEIKKLQPSLIIISPGPGKPEDAGVCIDVIKELCSTTSIFGVCLGHQAICYAFGAEVTYAKKVMHGKSSTISVNNNSRIFKGLAENIQVARYHSLAAKYETVKSPLIVTAETADKEVMAVEHEKYNIFGVQFHPESVMTLDGIKIMENIFRSIK